MHWHPSAFLSASFVTTHPCHNHHSAKTNTQHQRQCSSLAATTPPTAIPEETTAASSSSFVSKPVDPALYNDLLLWVLQQDGAFVHEALSIQPSTSGSGYGMYVTQDIPDKDTLLLQIPRSACVTLDNALQDETSGKVFAKLIESAGATGGNTVCLAGYLARERLRNLEYQKGNVKEDSQFGPYLATLPWERGINNQEHVLFWSSDKIDELLPGTMCYEEVMDLRGEVELAATILNRIIGRTILEWRGIVAPKPAFQWPWEAAQSAAKDPDPTVMVDGWLPAVQGAFVTLLTRAFQDRASTTSTNNGQDDRTDFDDEREKLVPILDLLQHSETPNIQHVMSSAAQGAVVVTSATPLQAGDELFNQYRSELEESMPYHRFFSRFGFVPGLSGNDATYNDDLEQLLRDKSSIFVAQTREV